MLLLVAATAAEAATAGDRPVLISGIGPAAAAAATMRELDTGRYTSVLNLGIAGGFAAQGVGPGQVVVADSIVHADLGVRVEAGWLRLDGAAVVTRIPGAGELATAVRGRCGPILTLSAMTGTDAGALELLDRHPGALAEAMEGAGVAAAAAIAGLPVFELRAVSNAVGRRDRERWDITGALTALARAVPVAVNHLEPR